MIILNPDLKCSMDIIGVGLIKISNLNIGGELNVIFQKGIGYQLIQKIFDLNRMKILERKTGVLIDLINDYTTYLHYFDNNNEIIVIIYLDKKESILKFSKFYECSMKLNKMICSNVSFTEIKKILENDFNIPKSDSVLALLIIGTAGHLFFSKIKSNKEKFARSDVQISGFISALLSFTKELIGQEPGIRLKQINFGNQQIYLTLKNDVIFAYLVEKEQISKIDKKNMELVSDEFLYKYSEKVNLSAFKGDISQFRKFEKIVDNYFTF